MATRHPGIWFVSFSAASYDLRAAWAMPSPTDLIAVVTVFISIEDCWLSEVKSDDCFRSSQSIELDLYVSTSAAAGRRYHLRLSRYETTAGQTD